MLKWNHLVNQHIIIIIQLTYIVDDFVISQALWRLVFVCVSENAYVEMVIVDTKITFNNEFIYLTRTWNKNLNYSNIFT